MDINTAAFPGLLVENITPFSTPGALFNGSIAPLTSFAIKGVIWYQGEANVERAHEYRELFPAMIRDWRDHWLQGDFPFLFVQLANYQKEEEMPGESEWAELREAQVMALELPATGMAVTIDIGEADDIHPKNKEEVGRRLGLVALGIAYDKDRVYTGPTFKKMKLMGRTVVIKLGTHGSTLVTTDKYGYIKGFQMAGKNRQFYWARAWFEDGNIVVQSDQVNHPVAVRYAWSSNPGNLDLYNKEGLPTAPFRTDDWEGSTTGKKFDATKPRF
jgi:sialate O-acetylesterase